MLPTNDSTAGNWKYKRRELVYGCDGGSGNRGRADGFSLCCEGTTMSVAWHKKYLCRSFRNTAAQLTGLERMCTQANKINDAVRKKQQLAVITGAVP